ncbi:hypothetical protein B0H63DRAFT_448738 [Podospora didyma]|uniref:Uncharacterized protein n=1 Tax=Podospora didyma TaxID=330526 RepID=A0AAE0NUN9_9PEZI|nr:hypothetical protein B0H63DRAFT_448738 [Podospora didyma]
MNHTSGPEWVLAMGRDHMHPKYAQHFQPDDLIIFNQRWEPQQNTPTVTRQNRRHPIFCEDCWMGVFNIIVFIWELLTTKRPLSNLSLWLFLSTPYLIIFGLLFGIQFLFVLCFPGGGPIKRRRMYLENAGWIVLRLAPWPNVFTSPWLKWLNWAALNYRDWKRCALASYLCRNRELSNTFAPFRCSVAEIEMAAEETQRRREISDILFVEVDPAEQHWPVTAD